MRGTPNHDGDKQFEMLASYLNRYTNVFVVMSPQVIETDEADIAVLPGFDRGVFRAKFPGLSKEEENEVFTQELGNILLGLKAQCKPYKVNILMSHYTVPGCNTESGQVQFLTQFEPVLTQEALSVANYDLVALGHIHRPQCVNGTYNVFYSGAVNAMNFNDEGQERGFWLHEISANDIDYTEDPNPYVYKIDNPNRYLLQSFFYKTPYREFQTLRFTDTDVTGINTGEMDAVAFNMWRFNNLITDKIVRVIYNCSDSNNKAFNKALLEKQLYDDGAFYVSEITPDKVDASANRNDLSEQADPEANLKEYLIEKAFTEEQIYEIVASARPIIAEAVASSSTSKITGVFEPIGIEVKNYRNYEEESFNFEEIRFCTINGQNGAGKSSLFMDAIIDCLY
jgi:exonuclease SbcC